MSKSVRQSAARCLSNPLTILDIKNHEGAYLTEEYSDPELYGDQICVSVAKLTGPQQLDYALECITRVLGVWEQFRKNDLTLSTAIQEISQWCLTKPEPEILHKLLSSVTDAQILATTEYDRRSGVNPWREAPPDGVLAFQAKYCAESILSLLYAYDVLGSDEATEDVGVCSDYCAHAVACAWAATLFNEEEKSWQLARLSSYEHY